MMFVVLLGASSVLVDAAQVSVVDLWRMWRRPRVRCLEGTEILKAIAGKAAKKHISRTVKGTAIGTINGRPRPAATSKFEGRGFSVFFHCCPVIHLDLRDSLALTSSFHRARLLSFFGTRARLLHQYPPLTHRSSYVVYSS